MGEFWSGVLDFGGAAAGKGGTAKIRSDQIWTISIIKPEEQIS
jgi:hypothetical protein